MSHVAVSFEFCQHDALGSVTQAWSLFLTSDTAATLGSSGIPLRLLQSLELATLTIPFYCSAPKKDCIITGAFFRQDIFPTWPCRQRDIVNDSVHLVAFKMVVLCLFRYRCVHTDAFMCVRVFLCMCAVYLNITPSVCVTASWLHAAESIRYFQIVFKKAPLRCNPAMQGTQ